MGSMVFGEDNFIEKLREMQVNKSVNNFKTQYFNQGNTYEVYFSSAGSQRIDDFIRDKTS